MFFPNLPDDARVVFYDTETGGVEPIHPTIQIAASAWDAHLTKEVSSFEAKLEFDIELCTDEALEINSFDAEAWGNYAVPASQGWRQFFNFLGSQRTLPMVSKKGNSYKVALCGGHNVFAFDFPRVQRAAAKLQIFNPMGFYQIDTYPLAIVAKHMGLISPEKLNLGALVDYFELELPADLQGDEGLHDAVIDCRFSALVCRELLAAFMKVREAA